jgi:hypothetical protein
MAAPILNTNDLKLQNALYRFTNTSVNITGAISAFKTPKNGAATIPSSITLTANTNIVFTAAATYKWSYALSTQPATWIDITGATSKTLTITNANFLAIVGEATAVEYRCLVSETALPTAAGFFTVTYSKEVSDPIIVDMTRSTAVIPCTSLGIPTAFTNTDTTITVSRGGVALAYSTTAAPNSFSVAIENKDVTTARTIGTISTTSTSYGITGITDIAVDSTEVIFTVTVYDASGIAVPQTFAKKITYNKITNGLVGGDATFSYIDLLSPVVYKSTSAASIDGTHTNITAVGKKVVGSALPEILPGYITITGNLETEAQIATAGSVTKVINNNSRNTKYTVKLYSTNTVSTAQLLDTQDIPVLFTGASGTSGSSPITVVLTNDSAAIPTNAAGTAGVYSATPTEIHVYEGTTELNFDAYTPYGNANGTWRLAETIASSIDAGTPVVGFGQYAIVPAAKNIIADAASVTYRIYGKSLNGTVFAIDKTQTFSKAYRGLSNVKLLEVYSTNGSTGTVNNAQSVKVEGVTLTSTQARGHLLYIISPATGTLDSATWYDTFNTTIVSPKTSSNATTDLIAAITAVAVDKIIVLTTRDGSAVDQPLRNLLNTFGGSLTATWGSVSKVSHIFIGMKGLAPGQGYELQSDAVAGQIALSAGFTPSGIVRQGASGTKSVTVSAFKWGTAVGSFSQAANYTWATGAISAVAGATGNGFPTGWTSSAPASTASGQTLYQINLTITTLATDTVTAVNWGNAVSNTIGYRQDGSIGNTGNSARNAYIVTTSATPPATPMPGDPINGSADVLPKPDAATGIAWSKNPTSVLTAGQFMYQSDGIYTFGGAVAWSAPYLSNLKVGSLSAISADLGVVKISTSGNLATNNSKTFGDSINGIFLGYSGAVTNTAGQTVFPAGYKFEVGPHPTTGNYFGWDGQFLNIRGGGTFVGTLNVVSTYVPNTPAMQITNSRITISDGTTIRVKIGDLS